MATSSPTIALDDPRFSRAFDLPADPAKGRTKPFHITYADYGYRNEAHPEEETVFLFFGPMMGSRWIHVAKDELAKAHKVRFINPDRPGFGGTDVVDVKDAMRLWLEAVPALLRHLNIKHVSLGCQSGGTVYALDLLLHHPELLHPDRPYLAIGAPWIRPVHTTATLMAIVQTFPVPVLRQTDKLGRLIVGHIGPKLGYCFGLSQAVVAKLIPVKPAAVDADANDDSGWAVAGQMEDDNWQRILARAYDESVHGLSSEAVLLMQKAEGAAPSAGHSGWGDWGDYDALVPRLAAALRGAGRHLRVDVFYAEKDILIGDSGTKGPQWFDQCWSKPEYGDVIAYQTTTVKGADHDWIYNLRWGAIQKVLATLDPSHAVDPGQPSTAA
ncbi:interferon-induced GTP-binding protein mx2 [Niveomyces insectorum RCEF 264]|uniref:Interferon-induced GTP-binding protein mx2 n=1 Tax=Niveomyces insectorum RCEF 264 TaxID=1081102 RepID=A0A162J763_9HYPO|nr:interferon-induced GTP-binding protein mx2 [Niveomyces insectorum RCEF 264]